MSDIEKYVWIGRIIASIVLGAMGVALVWKGGVTQSTISAIIILGFFIAVISYDNPFFQVSVSGKKEKEDSSDEARD